MSLRLKELSRKVFGGDVERMLGLDPSILCEAARVFNSGKGIAASADKAKIARFVDDQKVGQEDLLALLAVASFLQRNAIDTGRAIAELFEEFKEYVQSIDRTISQEQLDSFRHLVEPQETYRRRRIAITAGQFSHEHMVGIRARADLRILRNNENDIAVPRATIRLVLGVFRGEGDVSTRLKVFECDDEDLDTLIGELTKCREELVQLMRRWEDLAVIYKVSADVARDHKA